MSKPSAGGTQTTRMEPPDYVRPYLEQAARSASWLYSGQQPGAQQRSEPDFVSRVRALRDGSASSGGAWNDVNPMQANLPQYYPGSTVADMSAATRAGLDGTIARAQAGSPLIKAAQDYVTQGLSGSNTNPYLDDMYNMAAQKSRNVLSSEYARSGRNIDASAPARADMLGNLATSIYGGAYENDANRRMQMLGMASPLAAMDYMDLEQLRNAGSVYDMDAQARRNDDVNRFNFGQNAPGEALDAYIRRLSGMPGSTQTTQLPTQYRNLAAGAAGGALAGSQFGPQGALIGGGLGLLGGLF